METKKEKIRPKTKSELAVAYNKDVPVETAVRILRRWISRDSELLNALTENNYNKHSHILTPKQVGLIYQYLGEP